MRLISPKLTIPVHFDDYDVFKVRPVAMLIKRLTHRFGRVRVPTLSKRLPMLGGMTEYSTSSAEMRLILVSGQRSKVCNVTRQRSNVHPLAATYSLSPESRKAAGLPTSQRR